MSLIKKNNHIIGLFADHTVRKLQAKGLDFEEIEIVAKDINRLVDMNHTGYAMIGLDGSVKIWFAEHSRFFDITKDIDSYIPGDGPIYHVQTILCGDFDRDIGEPKPIAVLKQTCVLYILYNKNLELKSAIVQSFGGEIDSFRSSPDGFSLVMKMRNNTLISLCLCEQTIRSISEVEWRPLVNTNKPITDAVYDIGLLHIVVNGHVFVMDIFENSALTRISFPEPTRIVKIWPSDVSVYALDDIHRLWDIDISCQYGGFKQFCIPKSSPTVEDTALLIAEGVVDVLVDSNGKILCTTGQDFKCLISSEEASNFGLKFVDTRDLIEGIIGYLADGLQIRGRNIDKIYEQPLLITASGNVLLYNWDIVSPAPWLSDLKYFEENPLLIKI